jgi:hypothetical protein
LLHLGSDIDHVDTRRGPQGPGPHERVHGGVHGQEIHVHDRQRGLADPALRSPAEEGRHPIAESLGREVGLALQRRGDTHRAQVPFAQRGWAERPGGLQVDGVAGKLSQRGAGQLGGGVDVLAAVGDVVGGDRPVGHGPFRVPNPELGAGAFQAVPMVRQREGEGARVEDVAAEPIVLVVAGCGEPHQVAARVDRLDRDPRLVAILPTLILAELEGEPAQVRAAGRAGMHRQAGQIKRCVEADHRRLLGISVGEEDLVHELGPGQQQQPRIAAGEHVGPAGGDIVRQDLVASWIAGRQVIGVEQEFLHAGCQRLAVGVVDVVAAHPEVELLTGVGARLGVQHQETQGLTAPTRLPRSPVHRCGRKRWRWRQNDGEGTYLHAHCLEYKLGHVDAPSSRAAAVSSSAHTRNV